MLTNEVDRGFREFASMNLRSQRCREARATRPHRPGGLRASHVGRCETPDLRLHLSGRQDF